MDVLTAIGFLARRRDNEATGMYSRYMRIAIRAIHRQCQVRRVHQRNFKVAKPNNTNIKVIIQNLTIILGSGQPFNSK
ncbi:MAG: hypothetical protein RJA83_1546 [Pseudomonadota bacterium]